MGSHFLGTFYKCIENFVFHIVIRHIIYLHSYKKCLEIKRCISSKIKQKTADQVPTPLDRVGGWENNSVLTSCPASAIRKQYKQEQAPVQPLFQEKYCKDNLVNRLLSPIRFYHWQHISHITACSRPEKILSWEFRIIDQYGSTLVTVSVLS